MRRALMWLLSKLFPYDPPSAGQRSLELSVINATRKS
jgi:hypothetical protein